MSYVGVTSGVGERLLFKAHYHWLYSLGGALLTTLPLVVFALVDDWFGVVLLCFALFAVPFGVAMLIRAFASEIAVTSDRFVKKSGLVSFNAEDISLDKVEEIELKKTILGAILGYGDLIVHGSGKESISVTMIQSPERLRREIESAHDAQRGREEK